MIIFNFVSILIVSLCLIANVYGEIKLVNVLFRHGDRTPGQFLKSYANDPNINNTFYPMGYGGLTNKGKLRLYNFGKLLRSLYSEFLGEFYIIDDVEAVSSGSPRARMSLDMVLAGLYQPCADQQWHSAIPWQPVLKSFKSILEDTIFLPQQCEEYQAEYYKVKNSTEFQERIEKLKPFMEKLAVLMGTKTPIETLDVNHLYHTLRAEEAAGVPTPDWAKGIYPRGKIREGAILQYSLYGYNEKLRRLAGGFALEKVVSDMKNIRDKSSKRKIYLYSGHELNVVMLLQALRLYDNQIPEYSSGVLIELHEINLKFYVKVLYHTGIPSKIQSKIIPGCAELCPLDQFVNLLANVIPSERELHYKISRGAVAPRWQVLR